MDPKVEISKSLASVAYFVGTHCQIKTEDGAWRRFSLWPEQKQVLRTFAANKQVIVLKARQLGLTWLALCYALWLVLFKPGVTVLIYSLRDDEAKDALKRLKNVYSRLPEYMRCRGLGQDDARVWELSNGSVVRALPTSAGDSYTAALVLIDEADMVGHNLDDVLGRAKPTVDAGGQLFLVSRSNKKEPQTPFKKIYRSAKEGDPSWAAVFLPWSARPGRTREWYEAERASDFRRHGGYDYIHEHYPATDLEALAPSSLDKRIPSDWLQRCYDEMSPIPPPLRIQHIQGLKVYREPHPTSRYAIGADPAEGNPNSDDSALVAIDVYTGEEVASFASRVPPRRLAEFADSLSQCYNQAPVLFERNNHGHACILWAQENAKCPLMDGTDGKPGWLENRKGKTFLYDHAADAFRDRETILHTPGAFFQLQAIDGDELKAPQGENDDLAVAYVLALMAVRQSPTGDMPKIDHQKVQRQLATQAFGAKLGSTRPFGLKDTRR